MIKYFLQYNHYEGEEKKKSDASENNAQTQASPQKSNPFGDARPRDENEILKKKAVILRIKKHL